MVKVEFHVRQNVTYFDGKKYYSAHVHQVDYSPITKKVRYRLFYRTSNSEDGFHKTIVDPSSIKESTEFRGNSNATL